MRNGELPQSMYTPIPQNMTDSDSEEEFRLQINNSAMKVSGQMVDRNIPLNMHASTIGRYSDHDHTLDTMPNVHFSNTQSTYCNSDGEGRPYINMTNHCRMSSDADNVAILNSNLRKSHPMSSMRKLCFVVSIFVCILTVVLFIWVLPCSDNQSCPSKSEHIHTHNWLRNYERVELKGAINIVRGISGRSMNLVFMYRGNKFDGNDMGVNTAAGTKRNGIISLIGSSGQVGWYDEMINEPSIIDCTLIDADLSGDADCLVIDEFGEMGCINPISGQWIWHVAEKSSNTADKLTFPLVLPDVDHDKVNDLLIACTITNQNRTYNALKMISGATGRTIGQSYAVKKCSYIHKFQLDSQLKISFNCIQNDTEIRITKSLQKLYTLVTNQSISLPETISEADLNQHKFYGQRKDTFNQRNIYSVNEKQLIVENYGICPDSCNVTVTLLEEHKGKPRVIRNFNGTRMYGMVPARLSFNKTDNTSKSAVHGFVIKFWEWSANATETKRYQSNRMSTTINSNITTEFNKFGNILRRKRSWNAANKTPSSNKSVAGDANDVAEDKNAATPIKDKINTAVLAARMRLIKETIVLIVFNSTDIRIENTSQSNIVQFCRSDQNNIEVCQPDLNYQENSVLIADLDKDGSQELVSYYSTFVENENEANKWKLMTYVQLLRLESELPKLYAVDEKH